jgi:hypothetical protein
MEKKHIKGRKLRRELLSQIRDRINNGEERQSIFEDLCSKFIERDYIAGFIARVPSTEDGYEIRKMNSFLIIIIYTWAGLKLLTNLTIFIPIILKDNRFLIAFPIVFLWPAVASWMALQIKKYDGLFYRFIGLLSIVGICKELQGLIDDQPGNIILYIYYSIIITLLIVASVISFKIKKRFFSHLAFSGVKKEGGNFILGRK